MVVALYYLGLAFLFTHELDAMTHSEWRLLLVLGSLPDDTASAWFVGLHVPLFFFILWLSHASRDRVRNVVRTVVAAFFVVHAALHFLQSSREAYEFSGALSHALILGAAACGIAYLAAFSRGSGRRHQEQNHSAASGS